MHVGARLLQGSGRRLMPISSLHLFLQDENFKIKHKGSGLLSMANAGGLRCMAVSKGGSTCGLRQILHFSVCSTAPDTMALHSSHSAGCDVICCLRQAVQHLIGPCALQKKLVHVCDCDPKSVNGCDDSAAQLNEAAAVVQALTPTAASSSSPLWTPPGWTASTLCSAEVGCMGKPPNERVLSSQAAAQPVKVPGLVGA